MTWSGAFPIILGLAAVAYAAHSMCRNSDKRTTEYRVSVAVAFFGVLAAFCGVVMMGSGLGMNLFSGGAGRSLGYGSGSGGYGGGWW